MPFKNNICYFRLTITAWLRSAFFNKVSFTNGSSEAQNLPLENTNIFAPEQFLYNLSFLSYCSYRNSVDSQKKK